MYEKTNKTVVDVRQFPLIRQVVSYFLTATLLSLPLAGFTVDSAFTSYDDARFEVSLQANDDGTTAEALLRTGPELSFNVELISAESLSLPGDRLQPSAQPALAVLSPKDLISEIFIPPRTIS